MHRPLEQRRPGRVTLGDHQRQPVQQQVGRRRRTRRRARRAGGLSHLPQTAAAGQPASHQRGGKSLQVCTAGQQHVQRIKLPGRRQEQRRCVAAMPGSQRDLAAQQARPGALKLIQRPGLRDRHQRKPGVERAGLALGLRRRERPFRPRWRIGRQCHRPLQEGGRSRQPPARPGTIGRALQLARYRFVWPSRGLRPVPGTAIGIGDRIGRLRQRPVRGPPLPRRRCPVDSGADQRVPEGDVGVDGQQPGCLGRCGGVTADTKASGSPAE